jgi:CubicO group peptidase (beta-lactamase class C family)
MGNVFVARRIASITLLAVALSTTGCGTGLTWEGLVGYFSFQRVEARSSELKRRTDEAVQPFLDRGEGVGFVVGIVEGDKTYTFAYGTVSIDSTEVPDANTLFEIGSITKTFTGILLADLIQQRKMDLEDPIGKYLPESVQVPSRDGRVITVRDLATQSSGLPHDASNVDPHRGYADYTPALLYEFLGSYELTRAPGEVYQYSNVGAGLLGHAIALLEGQDYETMVTERICRPLGMTDTVIHLSSDQQARKAQGYAPDLSVMPPEIISTVESAGALRSTMNDMLKYLKANMGLLDCPLSWAMVLSHVPLFKISETNRIGLLWQIQADQMVIHDGSTGGFKNSIAMDPNGRFGVVVLSNCSANSAILVAHDVLEYLAGKSLSPVGVP